MFSRPDVVDTFKICSKIRYIRTYLQRKHVVDTFKICSRPGIRVGDSRRLRKDGYFIRDEQLPLLNSQDGCDPKEPNPVSLSTALLYLFLIFFKRCGFSADVC